MPNPVAFKVKLVVLEMPNLIMGQEESIEASKVAPHRNNELSDRARDGFQTARGGAEKLAPTRRPQPITKIRSRCDIQQWDRGHRQANDHQPTTRRRLTSPAVTKIGR